MRGDTVNWEPFLTCAVTGASDTYDRHPELPVTPAQIAASAVAAAEAGAAIVHIHVREPSTGKGSREPEYFREVVERIRDSRTAVLVNLTTGMGGDLAVGDDGAAGTPAAGTDFVGALERLVHVEELEPDICSLDCGTMNFDDDAMVFVNPPRHLRESAKRIRELGVRPELEVFDLGHIELARRLIGEGLIDAPALFQLCLGISYGAPATPQAMQAMLAHLPEGSIWSGFALGRMEMPMVAQAMLLGGNLRVGLEDNLYLARGVLASNADLVERARVVVESLGGRLASPAEARDRLLC
ncbi:MAG: beta-keto acid cleavage family enzyme [Acidimicrobiales bacterium]